MTQPPPRSAAGAAQAPRRVPAVGEPVEVSPPHASGPRPWRGVLVCRAPGSILGVPVPPARRRAWQAARLAKRHCRLGKGRRFPDKKRHEVVDTFLPVPIQNCIASRAARKSRGRLNRFLPRMSLRLRRVGHEGLKN